jgi:hypothetical protein
VLDKSHHAERLRVIGEQPETQDAEWLAQSRSTCVPFEIMFTPLALRHWRDQHRRDLRK